MKKYYKKARYIVEYILFEIFIIFLKIIGFKNSVAFCSFIAKFIGPKLKVTKIAKKNLHNVFGKNINTEEMIEQIWDNFGKYIGEFPFINELSDAGYSKYSKLFTIEGLEHVKYYQDNNQPFLLFSAHQANWDFVISHITEIYHKFAIIYRKPNNPYVNKKILQMRSNDDNVLMIPKGLYGAKSVLRAIKCGYSIALLVDQKMNDGIEVPFFGKSAMTANAIAKLSIQYSYPIIPCQLVRTNGSCCKMIIHPEIKYTTTKDEKKDVYNIMLMINQKLEDWIRENPTQWFWFHNRWKD